MLSGALPEYMKMDIRLTQRLIMQDLESGFNSFFFFLPKYDQIIFISCEMGIV